jgi:AraC-like DNA-binding protein
VDYVELAIVIISEAASEPLALRALRLRAWDLLVQPLAPGELDEALARLALERLARSPALPARSAKRPRRRSTYPAARFIRDNLHRHLSLADCARICNLSRCEFSRRFRDEHGVSFSEYVLRLRVQQAAALLTESRYSVSEAAFAVGFNDLSYFARVFRRFVGMPASLYRRSLASPA